MIDTLTSLRFFAILGVFLSHLGFISNTPKYKGLFDNYFYEGYIGVTFFFILSGFVLSYNYLNKFKTLSGSSKWKFTEKRIFKIYPLHFITFLISVPLIFKEILREPLKNFILALVNLMLLQSFIPITRIYFSYNAVSWNLSVFMFLYLLTPYLLYLVNKITEKYKIKFSLFCIFILYILGIVISYIFKDNAFNHWIIYISPFFRLIDFSIGLLLGGIYIYFKEINKSKLFFSCYEIIATLGLVILFMFHKQVAQVYRYDVYYVPIMCMIIFVFAFQKGVISKILKNNKFVYLGQISFSFYMIHRLVISYIFHLNKLNYKPVLMSVICFVTSILAASILYKYVENPIKNKVRQ